MTSTDNQIITTLDFIPLSSTTLRLYFGPPRILTEEHDTRLEDTIQFKQADTHYHYDTIQTI